MSYSGSRLADSALPRRIRQVRALDPGELAPDVVVAEGEDWARPAVIAAAKAIGAVVLRTGPDRALAEQPASWSPDPALTPAGDIAVLIMTSGTTGRPKRVELTYDRMAAAPVAIKVVDQLPRTPSLKISRALVREQCFGDPGPREPGDAPGTATSGDPHDR
jgi:acyl-coenzyme A synthetase/AMP-(fatty) acid ligase